MDNMEEYAFYNYVPIMQHEGMEYLKEFIKEHDIKNILEIGAAIGYSAINMALVSDDITITTIERDEVRYNEAIKNINSFDLNNRIKVIKNDAFNYNSSEKFDLIFIDAAKSQNIKFFEKFKNYLNKDGYIITDNINFHGLTNNTDSIKSRNIRQMVRKINEYIVFLKENNEFKTEFVNVGDGLSISRR